MLHKPTQRKIPKKYENPDKPQMQQMKKVGSKPVMRSASNAPLTKPTERQPSSVKGRINKVEQKVDRVVKGLSNVDMQNLLIQQIKGIKNELKEIKQHIGISKSGNKQYQPQPEPDEEQQEENIYSIRQHSHNVKAQEVSHEPVTQTKASRMQRMDQKHSAPEGPSTNNFKLYEKPKELIDVGKIQPYMKQFKIEVSKTLMPYYHGYHKKSSKPVIIKYCPQNKSMEPLFNLYERLWKNIVKSKHICINKVYDLNEPLATYILVLQANKHSLLQMLSMRVATVSHILCSLIRALQFFHECGFLYRNIHPHHVMYSYENEVVLIDLKNVKRFVDIKGKHTVVTRDSQQIEDEFVSNNRARGLKQGRKDDLESLGYLALFILQGYLPWNINNLVQVRSKLTLKQLCGKYPGLLQFMIVVAQMGTQDIPDYDKLSLSLAKI